MLKLAIIICFALLLAISPVAGARTYIVGSEGATHKSLGEAVGEASSGDTIYMKPGIYGEEVVIDKKLIIRPLIGEKGAIVLEGSGKETGLRLTADGCIVEGITLKNYTEAGITLESDENTIKNCQLVGNHPGLRIQDSAKNLIEGNSMKDCYAGVVLWLDKGQNEVKKNNMEGCSMGILLNYASGDIVSDNVLSDNSIGVWIINSTNADLQGNSINEGIYGFMIINSSNCNLSSNLVTDSKRGVYTLNTTRIQLFNQTVNNSMFGIAVENSSYNTITMSNIDNSTEAIGLRESVNNAIAATSITNSTNLAMNIIYSSQNSLKDNKILHGDTGVLITESSGNRFEANSFNDISLGLRVEGTFKESFDNSIDESNTIDGRPIAYFFAQSDVLVQGRELAHLTLAYCNNFTLERNTISNDALFLFSSRNNRIIENNMSRCYGMLLLNSNQNDILKNNLIENMFSGMYLIGSSFNNISKNRVSGNDQNGISLAESQSNFIRDNVVDGNFETGIWLNEADKNKILGNTISSNPLGVLLINSSNNTVYHNNFLDNIEQAEDWGGSNNWDMGNVIGGNYWSDHTALGNPSRGWSRVIKGARMDNYPFQNQDGWNLS